MANAPVCDITKPTPPSAPAVPKGVKTIPPGSTLNQVINIVNQNFNSLLRAQLVEVRPARVTETVTINSPNGDKFVFEQINSMRFVDPKTGSTWVWNR